MMQTSHLSEIRPRQNGISCRRAFYALGLAAVFAGSVLLFFSQTIRLSISTSSAHYGFFRIPVFLYPYEIQKGSWVLFTPEFTSENRSFSIPDIPYAKQIKGSAGDMVVVTTDREVIVAGHKIGRAKTHTQLGRQVNPIAEGVIPAGYLFVAGTSPHSRDSRYEEVGLIPTSSIDAVLFPLPELPLLGITNERFVSLIRENETIQLAIQKEGMP